MNILIVDDSEDLAEVISLLLEVEFPDAKINIKNHPIDALEEVKRNNQYSFIFCDYNMPEMDGLALCEEISKFSRSVCFIVSGTAIKEQQAKIKDSSFKYIKKPFLPSELVGAIKNHL